MPIQPLLEDVCRQVGADGRPPLQRARQRTITVDPALNSAVLADPDALRQVFIILLDNALVHTPPGAAIAVTTARANGGLAVSVRDSGQGIPSDVQPHIFERFYRADGSRSGGSTGLGLAIARELVEAQGGTIAVESKAGEGTVFTVMMPCAKEA